MLLKKMNEKLLSVLILGGVLFLSGCGSDRATTEPSSSVLGENQKDTDKDGLSDKYEIETSFTNPNNPDTDGDCLLDSYEIKYYETNATNPDTDGDGIADGIELYSYVIGESNLTCLSRPETLAVPHNPHPAIDNIQSPDIINALDSRLAPKDSDGDGLSDEDEKDKYGTDPFLSDSDKDGLSDKYEIETSFTNPNNPDTDGDCLLDSYEIKYYETNATNPDTDGDGIADGIELYSYGESNLTCLSRPETLAVPHNPHPAMDNIQSPDIINALDSRLAQKDSDGDGLFDEDEKDKYGTDPFLADSDRDGLTDSEELKIYDTNATNPDTDGDCLLDSYEIKYYETNATNPDTDGDGIADGIELYSYGESNLTCLSRPETLAVPYNPHPAIDNIQSPDIINALDSRLAPKDSDGDGLFDKDEKDKYGTDPFLADSDGDGLTDSEELKIYDTNATNPDTDNDGLKDGEEVKIYETNATNPDTDGDCLLDSYEIKYYETNATNPDTDGDKVNDGIEIYSYVSGELNTTCLSHIETLVGGYNSNPAIDGIPAVGSDIINALDPTNDSDGDGQQNWKENNCTEGDPLDKSKRCKYITESNESIALKKYGYAYVPGGFDVDGDGINEGGFWISRFQARASTKVIPREDVIADVGIVNNYFSENFKVLNRNIQVLNYKNSSLTGEDAVDGKELLFNEGDVSSGERISRFTPYLALVCLKRYKIRDSNGSELDINITMPTQKQYIHVKMLLDADYENNGDGRHIRNGLLGLDANVPLSDYTIIVDEFDDEHKEYVRNLIQIKDIKGKSSFTFSDIPEWWDVDADKFKIFEGLGAHATQDLSSSGIGPDVDPFGVIARGGRAFDVTEGLSGRLNDTGGVTNGISFRAATDYLY